jgi:hypothetical protein
MMNMRTRLELGLAVDPLEFLSVLRQMITTAEGAQSQLTQLEPRLTGALRGG